MRSNRYLFVLLVTTLILVSLYLLKGQSNQAQIKYYSKEAIWQRARNPLEKNDLTNHKEEDHAQRKYQDGIDLVGFNGASNRQHLKEALVFPSRVANFNFDACDMSTCFDFSLCNTSDTLKVHIVASSGGSNPLDLSGESNIIHKRVLGIIRRSKYYEPNPEKACLFVPEDDTLDRDPLSTSFRQSSLDVFRPERRFGMNHLIFNLYSGTWPDYRENDFSGLKIGAAILAKASNSLTYHRDRFDISIPLFSYLHPEVGTMTNKTEPNIAMHDNAGGQSSGKNKTYFLTFKGKRYVLGTGSETRNSLYHLNNQRDVIMLTTCRHGKKWREVEDIRCLKEDDSYEQYDFSELMKGSIFCLTPRGRRLGSFRFLEALNFTCIPVVLGDGWVWPFGELIDWTKAAIQFPESDLFIVPDTLRDYDNRKIEEMQLKCQNLYQRYFSTIEKIVMTTMEIIERRIKNLTSS